MIAAALLLAASFDGEAALRHASALSALGPRPWGSPRTTAAAAYIASQLMTTKAAVRLEVFESHGIRGANVIAVLKGDSPEFVVLGAHHDTAPGATGAYDDAAGVGVVIEAARVLAAMPRPRTIVLASWDGEEAWSTGKTTTAGSRAYVEGLEARSRDMVAALAVEMCGWREGTPVVHPIAYADPLRPGRLAIAPARVMRAVLDGSRRAGVSLGVGDPFLSWLYQPAVRTFRVRLYGDDLSFLQSGLPATFTSDSTFTRFYPWYHKPTDTPDKLDAKALTRMGTAVVGATLALAALPATRVAERDWFAAFGYVAGAPMLWAVGIAALVPGVLAGYRAGGSPFVARGLNALLAAGLMWWHLVPALWALVLPALISGVIRRRWGVFVAMLPPLALAALGGAAWARGMVGGVWVDVIDVVMAVAGLGLLFVPVGKAGAVRMRKSHGSPRRRPGLPGRR
jgi:peptidase M28-like protein